MLALRRHWRVVPLAMMLGAAAGVAVAKLVIKRTYTASSVLVWEPMPGQQHGIQERDLSTSVRSVTLPANLQEVRRRLGLWSIQPKVLANSIAVRTEPGSNLITISADGSEAESASALADMVVEVFLEHEQRLLQARSQETTQRIEADLESARAKLAAAREVYDAFRAEHGIADLATETQLAIQQVAELRASADLARADAEALGARATELAQAAKRQSAHQVQSATQTDPLLARRLEIEAELAAARGRLSADHPTVVALEGQIEALRQQESTGETRSSTVTIGVNAQLEILKSTIAQSAADREAALQRQEHYKRYASEAEQRLQQLSAVEGQASTLLSNINVYEQRVNRLEVDLVSASAVARSAQSEFRILTPAMVPEDAQSARKKVAAIAPILAALLTVLVLVARELRGFKVITATEAAYWSASPVVASSAWPRDPELLPPLVDELADFAPLSSGTTLVLPASDDEASLAREIAYWLSTLKVPERALLSAGQGTSSTTGPSSSDGSSAHAIVHQPQGGSEGGRRVAAHTWDGEPDGQAIRRAARLASRVLVVLRSGVLSVFELSQLKARLGRESGIGILLVGVDEDFIHLVDRAGDFHSFWTVDDSQA